MIFQAKHPGIAWNLKSFKLQSDKVEDGARRMPTHGSMTKAGKVRKATPKIEAKQRKRPSPRIRNRDKYVKLLEKPATPISRTQFLG